MTDGNSRHRAETMLFAALDGLKRGDTDLWAEMFCDDGVMEFPFAPPGYPERLDGKAAIAEFITHYPEHVAVREIIRDRVHHSDDVMIVEFGLSGTAVATGNAFDMRYIGVIELAGGRIKRYRDYWNPLVAVQAMGGAGALAALGSGEMAS